MSSHLDHCPQLLPLAAMVKMLTDDAGAELAHVLHGRHNEPITAGERRWQSLGYLALLLQEYPQPPDRLPHVPRKLYDQRRCAEAPDAPPSARLQERFRTWRHACNAAWGLREDGRSGGPVDPWSKPPPELWSFTIEEAVESVQAFARILDRLPSSSEYHAWILNRRHRARTRGESTRPFVPYRAVLRLLASDRSSGNGWSLVLGRIFGVTGGRRNDRI